MIVGAAIGLFYSISGGQVLYEIPNPDGRIAYGFLTTTTLSIYDTFIRPSGFYDEPGALSFFVTSAVLLRILFGFDIALKDYKLNRFLILTGFLSFSAYQFFVILLFCIYDLLFYRRKFLFYLITFFSLCFSIFLYNDINSDLLDYVYVRLSFSEGSSGRFEGANEFLNYFIDHPSILGYGDQVTCLMADQVGCQFPEWNYGPLTMFAYLGVVSLPYYLIILLFIIIPIHRRKLDYCFVYFLLILALLQRPYLFNLGYATIFSIFLFVLFFPQNSTNIPK